MDYVALYEKGRYFECLKVVKEQLNSVESKVTSTLISLYHEFNTLIVKSVILTRSNEDPEEWMKIVPSFLDFYTKLKVLYIGQTIPIVLYYNTVYSILWLNWMKKEYSDDSVRNHLCHILIDCFRKGLQQCTLLPYHSASASDEEVTLDLLSQTVKCLTRCETLHALMLVEISLLSLLFILDRNLLPGKCKEILLQLKSVWLQIRTRGDKFVSHSKESTGNVPKLFKFGFHQINDVVGYCMETLNECFCVLSALCFVCLRCAKESLQFLEEPYLSDGVCCKFLRSCLIAHGQLEAGDPSPAAAILSASLSAEGGLRATVGRLLAAAAEPALAVSTARQAGASAPELPGVLLRLLECGRAAGMTPGRQRHWARTLMALQTVAVAHRPAPLPSNPSLEGWALRLILRHANATRRELLHAIGREMVRAEVSAGAEVGGELVPGLRRAAADCFMDALCDSTWPERREVRDAAAALVLAGRHGDALVLLRLHLTAQTATVEELATLLLRARAHLALEQLEEAAQAVDSCRATVLRLHLSEHVPGCRNQLLDAASARVYLYSAFVNARRGRLRCARHCLARAETHRPTDPALQALGTALGRSPGKATPSPATKLLTDSTPCSVALEIVLGLPLPPLPTTVDPWCK